MRWDQAEKWFPTGVLSSVASGGTEAAPYGTAVLLALIYGAIGWGVSVLVLQRRDIVD